MTHMAIGPANDSLGGLLEAIESRGASGATLHVRLRRGGGWEVRHPHEQPPVKVIQADMDMAGRGLAIGSDLTREWQLAMLFAEHRETVLEGKDRPAGDLSPRHPA
jgi:hypothetical protein